VIAYALERRNTRSGNGESVGDAARRRWLARAAEGNLGEHVLVGAKIATGEELFVLHIENEPLVVTSFERALRSRLRGIRIRGALTLAEARPLMMDRACTAVILDLHLPDGDGFDALQELAANGATCQ